LSPRIGFFYALASAVRKKKIGGNEPRVGTMKRCGETPWERSDLRWLGLKVFWNVEMFVGFGDSGDQERISMEPI
jgi:hypothetical protein